MMGQMRRFERRLERIFEGPFAKVARGEVHPLEIARRLIREVDDGRALGLGETLAPNRFLVKLSPRDHDRLAGLIGSLTDEMESLVIDYSNRKGYHLVTRPYVDFQPDPNLREGEFSIKASLDEVARARRADGGAGAVPGEARAAKLIITRGGGAGSDYLLGEGRTRIGRGTENDLVLADPRTSRLHAEIERTPSGYVVRDLGSTNGTMVGGRRVRERLLEDGDIIQAGDTEMRFELLAGTFA